MRIASANCTALTVYAQPAISDLILDGDGPSLGGGYFTGPTSSEPLTLPDYCEYPAEDYLTADSHCSPAPGNSVAVAKK